MFSQSAYYIMMTAKIIVNNGRGCTSAGSGRKGAIFHTSSADEIFSRNGFPIHNAYTNGNLKVMHIWFHMHAHILMSSWTLPLDTS